MSFAVDHGVPTGNASGVHISNTAFNLVWFYRAWWITFCQGVRGGLAGGCDALGARKRQSGAANGCGGQAAFRRNPFGMVGRAAGQGGLAHTGTGSVDVRVQRAVSVTVRLREPRSGHRAGSGPKQHVARPVWWNRS